VLQFLDLRGRPDPARALAAAPGPVSGAGDDAALASVRAIIADVRARGDAALRELTARFDGCEIDDLQVPRSEIQAAFDAASPALRARTSAMMARTDASAASSPAPDTGPGAAASARAGSGRPRRSRNWSTIRSS